MTTAVQTYDLSTRRPADRGLNPTLLRILLRRTLTDIGAVVFAVVMPIFFFLMFGTNDSYANEAYGRGTVGAMIMTGLALYGVLVSTISAGTVIATERATGWNRQLRLTPLAPAAYIAVRAVCGMALGLVSLLAVYVVGYATGRHMPADLWLSTGAICLAGGAIFAALGLFLGFLVRSGNAMRIVGPSISLLAFLGGLFIPLDQLGSVFQTIAPWTPMYGIHQLSLAPYGGGAFSWGAVANVIAWLAISVGGAAWLMSRDTARV